MFLRPISLRVISSKSLLVVASACLFLSVSIRSERISSGHPTAIIASIGPSRNQCTTPGHRVQLQLYGFWRAEDGVPMAHLLSACPWHICQERAIAACTDSVPCQTKRPVLRIKLRQEVDGPK